MIETGVKSIERCHYSVQLLSLSENAGVEDQRAVLTGHSYILEIGKSEAPEGLPIPLAPKSKVYIQHVFFAFELPVQRSFHIRSNAFDKVAWFAFK
ncbi:MAG: hypothetical protein CMJ47_05620 [Planctomyces sp.]|nr:hypothetical protein [Planctomyces sp.]